MKSHLQVHAEVQEHLFHNPHLYEREETQGSIQFNIFSCEYFS